MAGAKISAQARKNHKLEFQKDAAKRSMKSRPDDCKNRDRAAALTDKKAQIHHTQDAKKCTDDSPVSELKLVKK